MIPRYGFHIMLDGFRIKVVEVQYQANSRTIFVSEPITHTQNRTLSGRPHVYRGKMLWRICNDIVTITLHSSATYTITLNVC